MDMTAIVIVILSLLSFIYAGFLSFHIPYDDKEINEYQLKSIKYILFAIFFYCYRHRLTK